MKLFLNESDIRYLVSDLAREIKRDYARKNPLLIGVLKGALYFTADLCRELENFKYDVSFCTAKSYKGSTSTGNIEIGNIPNVRRRHVILIDEISDTGQTIMKFQKYLLRIENAKTVEICTLINNLFRRKENIFIKYCGITVVKEEFFVGYGMDIDDRFRTKRDIYKIKKEREK